MKIIDNGKTQTIQFTVKKYRIRKDSPLDWARAFLMAAILVLLLSSPSIIEAMLF